MEDFEICTKNKPCTKECIIAQKIFDQCRLQICLTPSIIGPARAAASGGPNCFKPAPNCDVLVPPSNAVSVNACKLCITDIAVLSKMPNQLCNGTWDVKVKFTFSYCLTFFDDDNREIFSAPAFNTYTTTLSLFGGENICVASFNELLGAGDKNSPFLSIDANAVLLAASLRYPCAPVNNCHCGCCCDCHCGSNNCSCGSNNGNCGCGCGNNCDCHGVDPHNSNCGCHGVDPHNSNCGCHGVDPHNSNCGCSHIEPRHKNNCDCDECRERNSCFCGTPRKNNNCSCGNNGSNCGCGSICGCGSSCGHCHDHDCHYQKPVLDECGPSKQTLAPIGVNVTIGLFAVIRLARLSNLSVENFGSCVPEDCSAISPETSDPCAFFDNLDFPTTLFAPQSYYTPAAEFLPQMPLPGGCCCKKCNN